MTHVRAAGVVALVVAALIVGWPSVAAADPPGPTDYRTTVVGIEPPAPAVHVSVVGGDSFLAMEVDRGTAVEVTGYRGEAYVQFRADGTVVENRRSPTYFANRSRFGSAVPPDVTPASDPDWVVVADDGSFAWHDHRTHWMDRFRPVGKEPGDVVLEATIPLVVDGRATSVVVRSTWLPAPSDVPMWAGAAIGLLAGLVVFLVGDRAAGGVTLAIAAAALWLGWWQVSSVPSETGPSRLLVVVPVVAGVAGAIALVSPRSRRWLAEAMIAVAGLELVLWSWTQRASLSRAIVPTDAPGWLDRAVVAGAGTAGLLIAIAAATRLVQRT